MKRLLIFHIVIFCFLIQSGKAQQNVNLMNWKTEFTVRTFLLQQMHGQYDLRREAIQEALLSKEKMLAYREKCRQSYRSLLGDFPEKTPLNPQVVKILKQDGYRMENILIESLPNHHVTANFYVPDGQGPFPAALFLCGHEMSSKAAETYQKTAALFAKNGFAVLVVDPISQGERVQFTDENGERILRGSTTEHTLLNAGANLVGTNVVSYELWDNIRSLNYLAARPEVDADRMGCLGNSGGGTQTTFLIGFDDRIKVAAPCSFIAQRERNYELDGTADGCQQLPFEGENLLEIGDFLIMFAPKPVLILAGRYDFVNYTGTKETAEELKAVYSTLGEPEKTELFTVDDGHGISKPKREAVVQWFRRWLCNDDSPIVEPDLKTVTEQEINCTLTGQVTSAFADELTVQQINLNRAEILAENRQQFALENDLSGYQQKIKELLAIDDLPKWVDAELVGVENHSSYILKKYILRAKGEIPMPCLLYWPSQKQKPLNVVVYLNEEGKAALADSDSLIESTVKNGNVLVLADLRGFGETMEREDANEWKYYNREYHNATLSLFLGKPLVGQRVNDIFSLIAFLNDFAELKNKPVQIESLGAAGHPAIYAALFREQIQLVRVKNSISSYYDILEKPMELDWYSYVVPSVLNYFDLTDILKLRSDLDVRFSGMKVSNKKSDQR